MAHNQTLLDELQREAKITKKILEKVPTEHLDWKPHEKSFAISRLAAHIAALAGWLKLMINADELDFGTMNYTPPTIKENADIMKYLKKILLKGKQCWKTQPMKNLMAHGVCGMANKYFLSCHVHRLSAHGFLITLFITEHS